MPVPGFPTVMSFFLSHAKKEKGGLDLCLYLASYVMSFYSWQGEKGVVLTYVFPLIAKQKRRV